MLVQTRWVVDVVQLVRRRLQAFVVPRAGPAVAARRGRKPPAATCVEHQLVDTKWWPGTSGSSAFGLPSWKALMAVRV